MNGFGKPNSRHSDPSEIAVLWIDDDRDMFGPAFEDQLHGLGIKKIQWAAGVDEAVVMVKTNTYDIILSDMWLGGDSLSAVVDEIRNRRDLWQIPLVAVSAAWERDCMKVMTWCDGYLWKFAVMFPKENPGRGLRETLGFWFPKCFDGLTSGI